MSDNKVVQKGLRISVICYSYINHSYEERYFKVKESTKMSRVMEAFAEKEMIKIKLILWHGHPHSNNLTPES
ncbi:hypothetical protein ScalyP_jg3368 [Parmales sp. scaly parma]|nr:hypothetical protein ScalyP_jg3368 [Parmales sp. scaly parma]